MPRRPSHPPFLGARIAVLTAHPDDEGLAAGTMYENHKAGGTTVLICATFGEKGKSHLAKPASDAALKRIRRAELLRAAKILKIDEVKFLGFPDAGLRERSRVLFDKTLAVLRVVRPDYLLSFGPEGISAHWDHITVGRAARHVAKRLRIPLFAFTLSDEVASLREKEFFLARRKFGRYKGLPQHRSGDVRVKVDLTRKRRAMRSHVSQFGTKPPFAELPKRLAARILNYEHFVHEDL